MKGLLAPWLATALIVGAVASGCSTTKVEPPAPAPVAVSPPPAPRPAPPPAMAVPPAPPVAADPLDDPHSALATRSVYFDFDKALIEEAYIPALVAHGGYLGSHPARRLRVEGNCDERGGREYNLALGQRRADAVAQRLTLAGAQSAQIEAISYGKERPKALGHDEAAWTENRRADLVYH